MITPEELRLHCERAASLTEGINRTIFVATDDRRANELLEHKATQNALLVIIMPNYNGFGTEDQGGWQTFIQLELLEKTDMKTDKPEAVQEKLFPVLQNFLHQLFRGDFLDPCSPFRLTEYGTLDVQPITNVNQCHGWHLTFVIEQNTEINGFTQ